MEDETLHYRRAADLRTNMDDTEFGGGDILGLRTVEWVLPRSAESKDHCLSNPWFRDIEGSRGC